MIGPVCKESEMAQTSERVSSIASRFINLSPDTLLGLTASERLRETTAAEIRAMAASLLRQDEVRGIRKLFRKFTGRPFTPTFMSEDDRP